MHASGDHTVDEHRSAQRQAIAEAAWNLAQQHGPFAITMSQIADAAGVSRPTLYKYFRDLESMLRAHHRRHVEAHVTQLAAILEGAGSPRERLERLTGAYAEICHHRATRGSSDVHRLVHSSFELDAAESRLVAVFARAIREAEATRGGLTPPALAAYCVRALGAAADVPRSKVPAMARLVLDTLLHD